LSIHLCICLICVCVSSNNIRSNIKLWNGFKLFLNSTSRSLSCPVAIKDFYHKDRTPALNPCWSLAQKLCRSAVRLASAIAPAIHMRPSMQRNEVWASTQVGRHSHNLPFYLFHICFIQLFFYAPVPVNPSHNV
jgi:hypothetical protein